jgi:DNA-binding MarR family transcriptional regulator
MAVPSTGVEQAKRFSSPQEEALLNLMRTADCLHRSVQQRLKPSGLTATQYNVLRILRSARPKGLTCSAIGRMMITPEPDITRLLGRLRTQKFLSQERDIQDRRVVWTRITALGLDELAGLDEVMKQAPSELLKKLTQDELQELTRLLKKVSSCVERGGQPESQPPVSAKRPSPRSPLLLHPPE